MTPCAVACSVSRPISERLGEFVASTSRMLYGLAGLQDGRTGVRVLAVFDHACNLITPGGRVIAIVTPRVGDGPLNIVVHGTGELFAGITPGAPATLHNAGLQVGELEIDLAEAEVWEPCPEWERLHAQRDAIVARLPFLHAHSLRYASASPFLALLGAPLPGGAKNEAMFATARKAVEALRVGWGGDAGRLRAGTCGLAGLGAGLTPAGDDFLTGVMLWAWLSHPSPAALCHTLAQTAIPLTTTLSAAFLRAALRGECGISWHNLLGALRKTSQGKIAQAAQEVLAHGATSGADTMCGFLYAGMNFDTQADFVIYW